MFVARAFGVLCLLTSLYYGRFYLLRGESYTVAQMVVLLGAAAVLLMPERPEAPRVIWFRGWRPNAWQGWLAVGVVVAGVLAVFRAMDADAHSVSDTLHRIVPIYGLIGAVSLKLWYERSERRAH